MSDDRILDPYHGLRETWPKELLNAASQGAGIVFDHPVVRLAIAVDQKALNSIAKLEACGPVSMATAAYACGLLDDPSTNAVAACNFLGAASVARNGTGTQQLLNWAANQGWAVHVDNRRAGDLDEDLLAKGLIGASAMNTAYGPGNLWDTLHPQAGGGIGHWEVFGAVDGPSQENDMQFMDKGPAANSADQTARRVQIHVWCRQFRSTPVNGEAEMDSLLNVWVAQGAEGVFGAIAGS